MMCCECAYLGCVCVCVCVCVYLVAVQGVLRGAGGQRDGVWLAAALTLTVQVFSVPEHKQVQSAFGLQTSQTSFHVGLRRHHAAMISSYVCFCCMSCLFVHVCLCVLTCVYMCL